MDAFLPDVVAIERQIMTESRRRRLPLRPYRCAGFTAYVDEPSLAADARPRRRPGCRISRARSRRKRRSSLITPTLPSASTCAAATSAACGTARDLRRDRRTDVQRTAAPALLAGIYDSPRAGSFEPLRFVPKGRVVVLGLVSSKVAEFESIDGSSGASMKQAVSALEQLAISPQCGFASDVIGNLLGADDQRRKLEVVSSRSRVRFGDEQRRNAGEYGASIDRGHQVP